MTGLSTQLSRLGIYVSKLVAPKTRGGNELICHTSMLNECSRQFSKTFHCRVTRQLNTEARMGLRT